MIKQGYNMAWQSTDVKEDKSELGEKSFNKHLKKKKINPIYLNIF